MPLLSWVHPQSRQVVTWRLDHRIPAVREFLLEHAAGVYRGLARALSAGRGPAVLTPILFWMWHRLHPCG